MNAFDYRIAKNSQLLMGKVYRLLATPPNSTNFYADVKLNDGRIFRFIRVDVASEEEFVVNMPVVMENHTGRWVAKQA